LLVSDKRSTTEAEWLADNDAFTDVLSHNNFSTSASYIPPKILWLKRNKPEVYERTAMFGTSNSSLTAKFTGRHVTDNLDAEKFYHSRTDGYPPALLDALELVPADLPDVVPVGTKVGTIKDGVANLLNLPQETQFVVTTYDALAAFWGSGVTTPGEAGNVCGTCSSLRVYADDDETDLNLDGGTLKAQHFSRPDVTVVGGSNSLEGGLLEWAKSSLYTADPEDDDALFDKMEADAAAEPVGANGLVFLPYLLGERAPFDDPDARGSFFGLERKHGREDMVRSVFESIGFLTRHMVEAAEDAGVGVDRLKIAGGLTRRELACQIKADVTGKPIVLVDELENTALGCMIIMRSTVDPERNIEELSDYIVEKARVFEPDPEKHERYTRQYELFRELYETNRNLFEQRAALVADDESGAEQKEKNL
jgi:sugar (pentulose or hexulose) kinase